MPKHKIRSTKKASPTWADVSEAKETGVNIAEAIFLQTLLDKWGFDGDMISDFYRDVSKLSLEIKEGRVNLTDLRRTLREEYQIDLG